MDTPLPLTGIRVVDLTIWIQGPLTASILGDLGAEVIKVEKPGMGDFSRGAQSLHNQTLITPDGRTLIWEMPNRNKRGIAVDLRRPEGREVFYRLVAAADVMVTNLHPQTLREMQVDRATIARYNPQLVYAQATGLGLRGPYAEDPCQDTVGMARAGFFYSNPTVDGQPTYPPGGLGDVLAATMLAFGVVTALLAKERQGIARSVTASQLGSLMWLALFPVTVAANIGVEYPPFDRTNVANPLMNLYRCGDGQWFCTGLYITDRFWADFCAAMDLEHLRDDPRFATETLRAEHRRELIAILDTAFATRSRAEWEERFRARKLWCSIVNRYTDLPADPQVQANEYLITLDNGLKGVALPFELDGMRPPRRGAPDLGQDTDAVLRDICGYSWDEIVRLKAADVVW